MSGTAGECHIRPGLPPDHVCIFNFSERWLSIPSATLEAAGVTERTDHLTSAKVTLKDGALLFPPQGRIWLT